MSESDLFLVIANSLKELGEVFRGIRTDVAEIKELLKDRNPAPDRLMDNLEAEQYLGITARTLRRWREEDLIDFVKVKGRVYYDRPYIREVRIERERGIHPTLLGGRRR